MTGICIAATCCEFGSCIDFQGKQRGGADAAQLDALRQQLEAEQVARAAAEGRVDFLKGKVGKGPSTIDPIRATLVEVDGSAEGVV